MNRPLIPAVWSTRRLIGAFTKCSPIQFFLIAATALALIACDASLGGTKPSGDREGAGLSCGGNAVACGDSCVEVTTDPLNCGGCGVACAAGQYCDAGACVGFCASGELECAAECTVVSSDPLNCGACGVGCPAGQFCDAGACSASCSGTICAGSAGTQTCVYLDSNNDNCGACGVACPDGQACEAGACVEACPEGRAACGGGCVDIRTDAANCGACGIACPVGVACVEGACGGGEPVCTGSGCGCPAGQVDCNGSCLDTQSNLLHCGMCGNQCATGQECSLGTCQCPAGGTLCGEACTDVQVDDTNCGACGVACSGGTSCEAGTCQCDAGLSICDDTCVDFQTDRNNCGGCGTVCAGYEECVEGICKYDGDQCGGEARAIDISRVSMYQAVELDLFDAGTMVGVEQRAVNVIRDRAAMVRVFVEPGAGFTSRELSARIFVDNGGEIEVFHHKKSVSGASSQSNLESTFQLEVPAAAIQEATQYWVELVECGTLPAGDVGITRVPAAAETLAQFEAIETGVIKVVFVPLTHDGRTPDVSEQTIAAYARDVELNYPTTAVEWSVRAPINSNQSGISVNLGSTLDQVTEQREADGVDSDVYYYGLIDPASSMGEYCGRGCTTGVGWVPDADGWWAAGHRAAVGIGFETRGVGTFTHELGHNHGRNHAPCGGAGGPDPSYPYGGGLIGTWGYDLDSKQLKDPADHKDFMGYCSPNWVSDYSFNAYAERIRALNNVNGMQVQLNFTGQLSTWYRMTVTEDDAHWSSPVQGPGAPGTNAEAGFIYDAAGNVVAQVDVYRVTMDHANGFMLYVPEPQSGWHAVGAAAGGPILAY